MPHATFYAGPGLRPCDTAPSEFDQQLADQLEQQQPWTLTRTGTIHPLSECRNASTTSIKAREARRPA